MELALGPLLYYWPRSAVFRFYEEIAASPVATVYLGEVVCSRRHELRLHDWLQVAAMLADAGKEAVLSTQALIESESDLRMLRRITGNGRFRVEANDMSAVNLLAGRSPFVAGPHVNMYNEHTLTLLAELGAFRWVAPVELTRHILADLQRARPTGMQTEVLGYGRLPLAFSSRCFTARHRDLPKDDCRFGCIDHPDGLRLATREGEPFLVLNGIQTLSDGVHCLLSELDALAALGVDTVRIYPQSRGTLEVLSVFHRRLNGALDAAQAVHELESLATGALCNGYWHALPGMARMAPIT
jgi:collagenase-like PrtC family protease